MEELGDIVKRRRQELGLSQADLADATGVHLRQIRRYESNEQQPVLAVAARLAAALGVTVDELAGLPSERISLEGTWWAAWQTFHRGEEMIATQPVALTERGLTVHMEALRRSGEKERGAHRWRGELRLWDGRALTGWYGSDDGNLRSKGTVFFLLDPDGEYADGRWVGLSYEGPITTGQAALARTREEAQARARGQR